MWNGFDSPPFDVYDYCHISKVVVVGGGVVMSLEISRKLN